MSQSIKEQDKYEDAHTVYSDEWIEAWANRYEKERLADYGIRFDMFLECPLEMLAFHKMGAFKPLLEKQKRVQETLDQSLRTAMPGLAHEH